jgi:hypothetical protein
MKVLLNVQDVQTVLIQAIFVQHIVILVKEELFQMKTKLAIIIVLPEHIQMLEIHIVHLVQMGLFLIIRVHLPVLNVQQENIQMNINLIVIHAHLGLILMKEIQNAHHVLKELFHMKEQLHVLFVRKDHIQMNINQNVSIVQPEVT